MVEKVSFKLWVKLWWGQSKHRYSFADGHTLTVARLLLRIGAFRASHAPHIWNSLPLHVRTASSSDSFRSQLKTHLFSMVFDAHPLNYFCNYCALYKMKDLVIDWLIDWLIELSDLLVWEERSRSFKSDSNWKTTRSVGLDEWIRLQRYSQVHEIGCLADDEVMRALLVVQV